jgi:hypothetical protein
MAAGDILSVTIQPDGFHADVKFAGLNTGGTYAFGYGVRNDPAISTPKLALTVTSLGFDNTGAATTAQRLVYGVPIYNPISTIQGERTPALTQTIDGSFTSGTFVEGETISQSGTLADAVVLIGASSGPKLMISASWTIAGTYNAGTFVAGEIVTQATSGAKAEVLIGASSGTYLHLKWVIGTPAFDATHVITGGTSGATFTPSATAVRTEARANNSGVWTGATSGATFTPTAAPVDYATGPREFFDGTNTTVRFCLSDWIYDKDKAGGGNSGTDVAYNILSGLYTQGTPNNAGAGTATNNSTVTMASGAKVIGHFVVENFRPVNSTQTIEMFFTAAYRQAGGKHIARVNVTATGGTSGHVESGSATVMTRSSRADHRYVYAVDLNLSVGAGFTRGEKVTIRCTAYPWIGDSGCILDSLTDAGATIREIQSLQWTIMDKMIAVVDTATGSDTTGVASPTQATADASPCLTVMGAMAKIAAQNNTSFTLNRLDGGEVQLRTAGTYRWSKSGAQVATNGYVTVTRHSTRTQADIVWDSNAADTHTQWSYLRWLDMTVNRTNANFFIAVTAGQSFVAEKINMIDSQTQVWLSIDATNGNAEFLDCTTTNSQLSAGRQRLIRNCNYSALSNAQKPFGNSWCVFGAVVDGTSGTTNLDLWGPITSGVGSNLLLAHIYAPKKSDLGLGSSSCVLTNAAFFNILLERVGVSNQVIASHSFADYRNHVHQECTLAGQRFNIENDYNTPHNYLTIGIRWQNCILNRGNHRADLRNSNPTLVGGWAMDHSVGCSNNWEIGTPYIGDQGFWGLNSNDPGRTDFQNGVQMPGFVLDNSEIGANTGFGNYHVAASGPAQAINVKGPWTMEDVFGQDRAVNGPPGALSFVHPGGGFFA